MVLFFVVATTTTTNNNNKEEDKKEVISFHVWDGSNDISSVPLFDSEGDELRGSMSAASTAASDDDHQNKEAGSIFISKQGTITATRLRFMPSLQVLRFEIHGKAALDHRYCDNLMGWECLPSLQEISVRIREQPSAAPAATAKLEVEKVKVSLRRAANEHPNCPALDIAPLVDLDGWEPLRRRLIKFEKTYVQQLSQASARVC
ncbi:hypothetical protein BS78_05G284400 [Paspalum vaginatum]|nr:hypothetical protein BS78_05G284400 [Paspalum vaginatum]